MSLRNSVWTVSHPPLEGGTYVRGNETEGSDWSVVRVEEIHQYDVVSMRTAELLLLSSKIPLSFTKLTLHSCHLLCTTESDRGLLNRLLFTVGCLLSSLERRYFCQQ